MREKMVLMNGGELGILDILVGRKLGSGNGERRVVMGGGVDKT